MVTVFPAPYNAHTLIKSVLILLCRKLKQNASSLFLKFSFTVFRNGKHVTLLFPVLVWGCLLTAGRPISSQLVIKHHQNGDNSRELGMNRKAICLFFNLQCFDPAFLPVFISVTLISLFSVLFSSMLGFVFFDIKDKKPQCWYFSLHKIPGAGYRGNKGNCAKAQLSADTHPWCWLTAVTPLPLWKKRLFLASAISSGRWQHHKCETASASLCCLSSGYRNVAAEVTVAVFAQSSLSPLELRQCSGKHWGVQWSWW